MNDEGRNDAMQDALTDDLARIQFHWIQESRTGRSLDVKQWQKQMGIGEEE